MTTVKLYIFIFIYTIQLDKHGSFSLSLFHVLSLFSVSERMGVELVSLMIVNSKEYLIF